MTIVKCGEKGCRFNKKCVCNKEEIQIDYFGGNNICHSYRDYLDKDEVE